MSRRLPLSINKFQFKAFLFSWECYYLSALGVRWASNIECAYGWRLFDVKNRWFHCFCRDSDGVKSTALQFIDRIARKNEYLIDLNSVRGE